MKELSEQDVILFNQGDAKAFGKIFDQCQFSVFLLARDMVRVTEEAKDITQFSFQKLWEKRGHFNTLAAVRGFLRTTAAHASLDFLRRAQKAAARRPEMDQFIGTDAAPIPENSDVRTRVLEVIYRQIEALPDKCRIIFKLYFLEDLKNREIAERLRISEKTVRNQKSRALHRLKLQLFDKKILTAGLVFFGVQMLRWW